MNNLTFWECQERIQTLEKFISLLHEYTLRSQKNHDGVSHPINESGNRARVAINRMLPKVSGYMEDVGLYPVATVQEPPMLGGRVWSNLRLLDNIFTLGQFDVSLNEVLDYLEKAIGYYQDDLPRALFRTINPLWWLARLIGSIICLPFKIFKWAGYDSIRIERSALGKLYKAVVAIVITLVTLLAGLAQISDSPTFQTIFQKLIK